MRHRVHRDRVVAFTLARQHLMERVVGIDPVELVDRVGGLHATDHRTPYLSLLARLEGFRAEDLSSAWLRERRLDGRRTMRTTLHLVPAARLPELICAFGVRPGERSPETEEWEIHDDEEARLCDAILEAIARHGPQSAVTIKKVLPAELQRTATGRHGGRSSNVAIVLRTMWWRGLLAQGVDLQVPLPAWDSAPARYVRTAEAFGNIAGPCVRAEADRAAARWYFGAYGPAASEDWQWWSGLPAARARAAIESILPELAGVAVDDLAEAVYVPSEALEDLLTTGDGRAEVVRLLPYEDNAIKGYRATRGRFHDADGLAAARAFNRFGEALPTILVSGRIAGTWSWEQDSVAGGRVVASPFVPPDRATRRKIEAELARVAAFVGAARIVLA